MKSQLVTGFGIIMLVFGITFTLQGSGLLPWPKESFMIGQSDWTERGIVVALFGLGLILTGWRIRR
jgi:hypothetical protein